MIFLTAGGGSWQNKNKFIKKAKALNIYSCLDDNITAWIELVSLWNEGVSPGVITGVVKAVTVKGGENESKPDRNCQYDS